GTLRRASAPLGGGPWLRPGRVATGDRTGRSPAWAAGSVLKDGGAPASFRTRLGRGRPSGRPINPGLRLVQRRKLLLQRSELREVVQRYVRIMGVACEKVLVVLLGRIEVVERSHLRHDGTREYLRLAQLIHIAERDLLLSLVRVEDRGAILGTHIRTLSVQLRRIVRHRKENLQQATVRDLRRIVGDPHRFGMPGRAGADDLVLCRRRAASRIA